MKRLGVALIVGLLAASPLPVGGQPNSAAPDQTPKASASNEDKPSSYVPGLGEFMGRIQVDHAKLWLAGEARNWELAGYPTQRTQGSVFRRARPRSALPQYSGRRHDRCDHHWHRH